MHVNLSYVQYKFTKHISTYTDSMHIKHTFMLAIHTYVYEAMYIMLADVEAIK